MNTLVVVEVEEGRASLVSRETLTFARAMGSGELHAVVLGAASPEVVADCAAQGVVAVHEVTNSELTSYAAAAWAAAVEAAGRASRSTTVIAGGTNRGNEVLAHVGARRNLSMAANVVTVVSGEPLVVERQVVQGNALETMALTDRIRLFTMARHAVAPEDASAPGGAEVRPFEAPLQPGDLAARVVRVEARESGDASGLTSAQGRRRRRARGRERGWFRGRRSPGGPPRWRRRLLARRDLPRLAPAPRAGRPDRLTDRAGPLHRVRHQRRDPALGGVRLEQDNPGDQHRPGRADDDQGGLRRRRRHARGLPALLEELA